MIRAVALSDDSVQVKVKESFIPLKVKIEYGTKDFPLGENWSCLAHWRGLYKFLGGEKCGGFTGTSVVSPDLQIEYGNGGPGMIWELFESAQYDAKRFAAMLDRAAKRAARERSIRANKILSAAERERLVTSFRADVRRAVAKEGEGHLLPPTGFTIQGGLELHSLAGDTFSPK